jgi:hypothetical protein
MQSNDWRRIGIVASTVWAIAGANAGMHLAVAPAISAYSTCLQSHNADSSDCRRNLHRDWSQHSGDRLEYAALVGLGPLPMAWLIAYGVSSLLQRRRSAEQQSGGRVLNQRAQARAA